MPSFKLEGNVSGLTAGPAFFNRLQTTEHG